MHVPPLPVTVSPAAAPVLLSTIPFAPPFAEMLRNVSPLAPIVVWVTLTAVPVVVAIVFAAPVTLTVPPLVAAGPGPVAVKPALPPVESVRPPVKLMVAPVLLVRRCRCRRRRCVGDRAVEGLGAAGRTRDGDECALVVGEEPS